MLHFLLYLFKYILQVYLSITILLLKINIIFCIFFHLSLYKIHCNKLMIYAHEINDQN